MAFLDASHDWAARFLLQRSLGAIYLVAFLVAANQFVALCGERGILPARARLARLGFWQSPSLFRAWSSDRAFRLAAWLGVGLALVATSGLSDAFGDAVSCSIWAALWALYLSFVNVGGLFYGYGWETLLLETGFLAIFLGPTRSLPTWLTIWLVRWVLFRVMFGAGLIKMRGDSCWRDLTCMDYHYETQPLPNPWSFLLHRSPRPVHRLEVLGTHCVQLVLIWGIFLPQPVAAIAGLCVVGFQALLIVSGNLSWLNYLTLLLAFACFDDRQLAFLGGLRPATLQPRPFVFDLMVLAMGALVLALSIRPARNLFSRRQLMNASFEPFHLVNSYGAFGSITRHRQEIEIEATLDARVDDSTRWQPYRFKGKPGDPRRRPPFVAPYHLRLDWQMWFAAMTPVEMQPWFPRFVQKLLEADPAVLALLAAAPFGGERPRLLRAIWYRYRFSTIAEWRATGAWWQRERIGDYLPPVALASRR